MFYSWITYCISHEYHRYPSGRVSRRQRGHAGHTHRWVTVASSLRKPRQRDGGARGRWGLADVITRQQISKGSPPAQWGARKRFRWHKHTSLPWNAAQDGYGAEGGGERAPSQARFTSGVGASPSRKYSCLKRGRSFLFSWNFSFYKLVINIMV